MPTGVYKHNPCSELTKLKIGKANKGRKPHAAIAARLISPKALEASLKNLKKATEGNIGKIYSLKRVRKIKKGLDKYWAIPKNRIANSLRQQGEKSYKWKGGITPASKALRNSIHFKLWREAVFARDNWTCQSCHKRGGTIQLHPHHIKSFADFPELRFAIDNGQTLCSVCHQTEHGQIKLSEVRNHG